MNLFTNTARTILHSVVANLSHIHLSDLEAAAKALPALVAKAEAGISLVEGEVAKALPAVEATASAVATVATAAASSPVAATGWQKLEAVVEAALPLVPTWAQGNARAALTILTAGEVLIQRLAGH